MPTSFSLNGAAFMLKNEGWSDKNGAKGKYGIPGTDATALRTYDGKITVGPGLTDSLNATDAAFKPIKDGVKFTAAEICRIWVSHEQRAVKDMLKKNPKLG